MCSWFYKSSIVNEFQWKFYDQNLLKKIKTLNIYIQCAKIEYKKTYPKKMKYFKCQFYEGMHKKI
jgi:hypothetical protein